MPRLRCVRCSGGGVTASGASHSYPASALFQPASTKPGIVAVPGHSPCFRPRSWGRWSEGRQTERMMEPTDTLTWGGLISEEEAIFKKHQLNRVEIVAKEISPVSTRCDFCVTDSLTITLRRGGRNTVFLSAAFPLRM